MNGKENDEVLITGYEPAAQFLTEHGYPISRSSLSKVGSPAIAEGPEVEGYWNRRPSFRPSVLLAWARARMTPNRPASKTTSPVITTEPARRGRGRPRKTAPPAISPCDAPPVQPSGLPPSGER